MSLLKQFRLSPRWLVLLVGVAAFAVTTAALVPHDEGISEHFDCLVCKAGHQPLTELSVQLIAEPPAGFTSRAPAHEVSLETTPLVASRSPRAPPA